MSDFAERANKEFQEARSYLKEIIEQSREKGQDITELEAYREPLSVGRRKEIKILLSWGGPADGYLIYFDEEGTPVEGFYFFADWFEYEEYRLSDAELDQVLTIYRVDC
jgi:hypothetical protein